MKTFKFILLLIGMLSCLNCGHLKGPECIKNNKKYGTIRGVFRGNCWNYYERGLSYAEGNCFDAAIDDFQNAIQCVRNDCKIDQFMAPTYGLHFSPYFPHREMGVVFYKKGEFENAKKKLERSLSDVDSERARYYLDLVRKKRIEKEEIESCPKITIHNDCPELVSTSNSITLSGCIIDEFFVSDVILTGAVKKIIRYSWEGAEKKVVFNEELDLPQGRHKIIIKAKNLANKISEKEQKIIIDKLGPILLINMTENADELGKIENQESICVSIYDDSMVHSLTINNQKVDITPQKKITFCKLNQLYGNQIKLTAKDSLGNISHMTLDKNALKLDDNKPNFLAFIWNLTLPPIIPKNPKKKHPSINIIDPEREKESLYHEYEDDFLFKIRIDNENSLLRSVTINDVDLPLNMIFNEAGPTEPHLKGSVLIFDHVVRLNRGKNEIEIKVSNTENYEICKTIIVMKKTYPAFDKKNTLRMYIHDLDIYSNDKEDSIKNEYIPRALGDSLEEKNRFVIVDNDNLAEYTIEGYIKKLNYPTKSIETVCTVKFNGERLKPKIDVHGCAKEQFKRFDLCVEKLTTKILRKFIRRKGIIKNIKGNKIVTNIQYKQLGFQKILTVFDKNNLDNLWNAKIEDQSGKNTQATLFTSTNHINRGFQVITK